MLFCSCIALLFFIPFIVTSSCLNNPSLNEYKCSSSALERVFASAEVKSRKVMALRSRSQEAVKEMVQSIIDNDDVSDPFYVLDLGVVVDLWHKWQEALPTVCPFYAVKCNPEPALLSALATLGSGFYCASRVEIEAILKLGVSPDRIVYANPCNAVTHLKYAASVGVNLTTFDSIEEVEKIKKFHPRCALLLRVKVPNEKAGGARIPLGRKYGALPEEVEPLLQAAQESGLAVHGVSFHVGSSVSQARSRLLGTFSIRLLGLACPNLVLLISVAVSPRDSYLQRPRLQSESLWKHTSPTKQRFSLFCRERLLAGLLCNRKTGKRRSEGILD